MRPIPGRFKSIGLFVLIWGLVNVFLYRWLDSTEPHAQSLRPPISPKVVSLYSPSQASTNGGSGKEARGLPYRLMAPSTGSPGRRYPLLLFLHGSGQRGHDNQSQLRGLPEQMAEPFWRTQFPCFVLVPQCPAERWWTEYGDELDELIRDVMSRYPIDKDRIYVTGLSMGGFGCWMLAAKESDLLAAAVPICGGGDEAWADQLVSLPIWTVHGDADDAVSVELTRQMTDAIRKAGGQRINYTELKGVGHNSWTQTYRDPDGVLRWMFQQRRKAEGGS